MKELANKIRRFSKKDGFNLHQQDILNDIALIVSKGETNITKIQEYFTINPQEYTKTFGDIKMYVVINHIRKLKNERNSK